MPQNPSPHRDLLPLRPLSRRTVLGTAVAGTAVTALLPGTATAAAPASGSTHPTDRAAAAEVHAEFLHGWRGYTAHAWGYDEVCPVSRRHHDFFAAGHTFGLSMVEALDTLYLMGEDAELARSCDWIEAHLDPAQNCQVQLFEAVIRLVGGLLAGHLATGRASLLARARELSDRLLPAFTKSPTGIPYTHVNLRTGAVSGTAVPLAEACTNVMEFGLLSDLTGDGRYFDASMRAYRAVISRRSSLGLLGSTIHTETGRWIDATAVAPNPPVDSFYEYLWGGSALLGDRQLGSWYRQLTAAIIKHQAVAVGGRLWFRSVDSATGEAAGGTAQSELGAFYAGLLAKGGDLKRGQSYFRTWSDVLARYPVLPETVDPASLAAVDKGSRLRPEYANAAFDLWRLTGDAGYKRAAYRDFAGMRANQRVAGGYTVSEDVTVRGTRPGDLTPAYWFAENMKYQWLMFSATPRFDYRSGILSTEGKVLSGLVRR
ncbi:glycoside hydrolase family 47 protein [Streptacidiphilus carbonis]|uniref:glycoside hydrolase family 47 protein n=1 Tax=Streptacidiphilus carbonis TaxID=105422 RepID=UPI0005A81825|nr:glycoside hydrolase family 47 protein [Streptacidiphilus carbonis]